ELARTYVAAGQRADAERLLAETHDKCDYVEPLGLAWIYTALGQSARALEWLERGAADRTGPFAGWLHDDPRLDSLRSEPRMQDLLRGIGLGAEGAKPRS